MALIGCIAVLAGILTYFSIIFAFHRFTYKTWMFDAVIAAGMLLAALSWLQRGGTWLAWAAIALGVVWFIVSRVELSFRQPGQQKLRVGDPLPAMSLLKTDGMPFTERDLIASAPALLTLYRGWWCPTSKAQLNGILENYEDFRKRGVSVYAASVDEPDQAQAIQEYVGDRITILCSASEALLETIGVIDRRGAPWYDRMLYGAPKQCIAMPTTLAIDKDGKLLLVYRAARLDDRPRADAVLAI